MTLTKDFSAQGEGNLVFLTLLLYFLRPIRDFIAKKYIYCKLGIQYDFFCTNHLKFLGKGHFNDLVLYQGRDIVLEGQMRFCLTWLDSVICL